MPTETAAPAGSSELQNLEAAGLDELVDIAQLRAGIGEWQGDSRFAGRAYTAVDANGAVKAAVSAHDSLVRHLPLAYLPDSPVSALAPDTAVTIIGGLARLRGGGAYRADAGPLALRPLVDRASADALATGRRPLAFGVPNTQVPAFRALNSTTGACWFTLPVPTSDEASFVAAAGRRVRQTWTRDFRDHEDLARGLRFDRAPVTWALLVEAGELFASVQARNGVATVASLSAYRALQWRDAIGGEIFAFTARDATQQLRAVTILRAVPDGGLDVYEIGLDPDPDLRRSLYNSMIFVLPLREALRRGLTSIDYGTGHPTPKRLRGCVGEQLWNLH